MNDSLISDKKKYTTPYYIITYINTICLNIEGVENIVIFKKLRKNWIRIRILVPFRIRTQDPNSNFCFLIFSVKGVKLITIFFKFWAYYSRILYNKWFLYKNYILMLLVELYASLSRFFLLPGSGSTFHEVEKDPDPKHWNLPLVIV